MKTFTYSALKNRYGYQIEKVIGLNEQQLEEDFKQYQKMQPDATVKDYMWSLFNRMILNTAGDYSTQSGIYHSMAAFVAEYDGKNGNKYKRKSLAQEVNKAQMEAVRSSQSAVWELEIIADPDCEHAKYLDGNKLPITNDLVLPLANDNCTREFCRCTTSIVPKRDEDGRIIFNKRPLVQKPKKKKKFWDFLK